MAKKEEKPDLTKLFPDEGKVVEFGAVHQQEDALLTELRKSPSIEDQIIVVLMEPHIVDEHDSSGLWYDFAKAKAQAIVKRFNVEMK